MTTLLSKPLPPPSSLSPASSTSSTSSDSSSASSSFLPIPMSNNSRSRSSASSTSSLSSTFSDLTNSTSASSSSSSPPTSKTNAFFASPFSTRPPSPNPSHKSSSSRNSNFIPRDRHSATPTNNTSVDMKKNSAMSTTTPTETPSKSKPRSLTADFFSTPMRTPSPPRRYAALSTSPVDETSPLPSPLSHSLALHEHAHSTHSSPHSHHEGSPGSHSNHYHHNHHNNLHSSSPPHTDIHRVHPSLIFPSRYTSIARSSLDDYQMGDEHTFGRRSQHHHQHNHHHHSSHSQNHAHSTSIPVPVRGMHERTGSSDSEASLSRPSSYDDREHTGLSIPVPTLRYSSYSPSPSPSSTLLNLPPSSSASSSLAGLPSSLNSNSGFSEHSMTSSVSASGQSRDYHHSPTSASSSFVMPSVFVSTPSHAQHPHHQNQQPLSEETLDTPRPPDREPILLRFERSLLLERQKAPPPALDINKAEEEEEDEEGEEEEEEEELHEGSIIALPTPRVGVRGLPKNEGRGALLTHASGSGVNGGGTGGASGGAGGYGEYAHHALYAQNGSQHHQMPLSPLGLTFVGTGGVDGTFPGTGKVEVRRSGGVLRDDSTPFTASPTSSTFPTSSSPPKSAHIPSSTSTSRSSTPNPSSTSLSTSTTPSTGPTLRLLRPLGHGAFSSVWLAEDLSRVPLSLVSRRSVRDLRRRASGKERVGSGSSSLKERTGSGSSMKSEVREDGQEKRREDGMSRTTMTRETPVQNNAPVKQATMSASPPVQSPPTPAPVPSSRAPIPIPSRSSTMMSGSSTSSSSTVTGLSMTPTSSSPMINTFSPNATNINFSPNANANPNAIVNGNAAIPTPPTTKRPPSRLREGLRSILSFSRHGHSHNQGPSSSTSPPVVQPSTQVGEVPMTGVVEEGARMDIDEGVPNASAKATPFNANVNPSTNPTTNVPTTPPASSTAATHSRTNSSPDLSISLDKDMDMTEYLTLLSRNPSLRSCVSRKSSLRWGAGAGALGGDSKSSSQTQIQTQAQVLPSFSPSSFAIPLPTKDEEEKDKDGSKLERDESLRKFRRRVRGVRPGVLTLAAEGDNARVAGDVTMASAGEDGGEAGLGRALSRRSTVSSGGVSRRTSPTGVVFGELGSAPGGGAGGRLVAVKMTPRRVKGARGKKRKEEEERTRVGFVREVEVLKHISHPNITPLLAHLSTATHHILVLPFLPGGDLLGLVNDDVAWSKLSEPVLRRIWCELCKAVEWMHGVGLVHRDIKLENILLTTPLFSSLTPTSEPPSLSSLPPPTSPLIKLSDFGLSRFVQLYPNGTSELLTTRCGSEAYAAPELVLGGLGVSYDARYTDAWACGVVLYGLVGRQLPFGEGVGVDEGVTNGHGGRGHSKIGGERGAVGVDGVGKMERKQWLMKIALGEWRWPGEDDDNVADADDEEGVMKEQEQEREMLVGPTLVKSKGARRIVERLLVRDRRRRARIMDLWDDEWMKEGVVGDGSNVSRGVGHVRERSASGSMGMDVDMDTSRIGGLSMQGMPTEVEKQSEGEDREAFGRAVEMRMDGGVGSRADESWDGEGDKEAEIEEEEIVEEEEEQEEQEGLLLDQEGIDSITRREVV